MSLLHLPIATIVEDHIRSLVNDRAFESRNLDFKETHVLATDDQKREFLSDVAAFANTDGGDLLFGVKAEKGVAVEIVGLRNFAHDVAVGTVENLLRDSMQPRLTGVQFRTIPLQDGNSVHLVRIPRSFAAPHMVRHRGVTRFCGRNANGKYDLDVMEIRSAFLANEGLADRLRSFRLDRLNRLASGESPLPLTGRHLIVLHILPVIGARPGARLTTGALETALADQRLRPIGDHGGWGGTFTFDGVAVASSDGRGSHYSVVRLLRNGYLEAMEATTLEPRTLPNRDDAPARFIPSVAWEQRILRVFSGYLEALAALGFVPPYVVGLGLLNIRGFAMAVDPRYFGHGARLLDRDHLLTDEVLIEEPAQNPATVLRPLFDQVWNACGWPRSLNYDNAGTWRQRG